MNRGRGTQKRPSGDHVLCKALALSLLSHVLLLVVLQVLHERGVWEKSVLQDQRAPTSLRITTGGFPPRHVVGGGEGTEDSEESGESGGSVTDHKVNSRESPSPAILDAPAQPVRGDGTSERSPGKEVPETGSRGGFLEERQNGRDSFPSADYYGLKELKEEIEGQLFLYIEKHKRYPSSARRRGLDGEVELLLTMIGERSVDLESVILLHSAGSVLLDREARRLVESFFPYEPTEGRLTMSREALSTTVKISYRLR